MSFLFHVFSDLAGRSQCFEPKPHGQLPSVPQPCCGGGPSLTGQQAQQPVFCPLCVPSGPFLPSWREQPLHCGQYCNIIVNRCGANYIFYSTSFRSTSSGRTDGATIPSMTPSGSPMALKSGSSSGRTSCVTKWLI